MTKNNNEKQIIYHIIYVQQENKIQGFSLDKPKINKFNNKQELIKELEKNKLVLVDSSFLSSRIEPYESKIHYYLYDNKVEFDFFLQEKLILETNDNIIKLKSDNNIQHPHLMLLAKIFYFRKFLSSELFNGHKMKNSNNKIFLIKKVIIEHYLKYFNYETLSVLLNIINIEYQNLEQSFDLILNNLKENLKEYYEKMNLNEMDSLPFNFDKEEYYLKPKSFDCNNKLLNYVTNFEMIDEDIYSNLKENLKITDNQVIQGQYIAEDQKIFLAYNCNNKKFYEIGSLDLFNWKFTVENILEETSYKQNIFEYFNNVGIKTLLQNIKGNMISFELNLIAYCYEVKIVENETNNDIFMQDNQYKINDIVSTLITLYKFEEIIRMKLELSKYQKNGFNSNVSSSPFSTLLCKLVSETFIAEIKKLFNYQKLKNIIKTYNINIHSEINEEHVEKVLKSDISYKKFLFDKQNEFIDIKQRAFEFYKIASISSEILSEQRKEKFHYPIKFNLIDSDLFDRFLNILDLKVENSAKKVEEIFLTFNCGNCVFRGMKENSFGNYMQLLYVYSSNIQQEFDSVNYYPEIILDFPTYQDLIKTFPLITQENIMQNLKYNKNNFISKYKCKICLNLSKDNQSNSIEPINNSDTYEDDNNKYYNQFLKFSFLFSLKYINFYDSLKSIQNQKNEQIYLINKKFIDELKIITHFKEFIELLQQINDRKYFFTEADKLDLPKLKRMLNNNVLKGFMNVNKNDILKKLANPILYDKTSKHLENNPFNNLFYYENFQIIDKELFEHLKKLVSDLKEKCIEADAIFSKNKVILLLNEKEQYVINVGKINSFDEFELEYLIQSEFTSLNKFDLQKIFGVIYNNGYEYFINYIVKYDRIDDNINQTLIKAKIYRLSSLSSEDDFNIINNTIIRNNNEISQKLKAMILLSISQKTDIKKFQEHSQQKIERVYLMNYNYLLNNKFEEISSLINNNYYIEKLIEEIIDPRKPYDPSILEEIISKLNQEELKKIDKELQMMNTSYIDWEAKADKITLKDYKSINFYRQFVLIKEKIYKEIRSKLSLATSFQNIKYAYKDGDIMSIHDYNQNSIFFGNINLESHYFNLRYILIFHNESYLDKELNYIIKHGIDHYMQKKTIFSEENTKDSISAIYDGRDEIGYFYKYSPGSNYGNKGDDYTSDMNNEKLKKVIKLYNYYNEFKLKMGKNYNSDKSYFLINKNVMNDIKKDYNYDIITQILNKAQFDPAEMNIKKEILYVLKNMPEDVYEEIIKNKTQIEKRIKEYTKPETISVTIPNTNISVTLYHNFEIIDASIANEFISDIIENYNYYNSNMYGLWSNTNTTVSGEHYMECTLKEGKVIVYYPKAKFNNNKYAYTIGIMDNDNTFKGQYLIIYKKNHANFATIKQNLINNIKSFDQQLIYGPYPLTDDNFEDIGNVASYNQIGISSTNINNDYPKNPMDSDNNEFKYDEPKPPIEDIDFRTIKEYNLDAQITTSSIFDCFITPPLIGLDNIGATCYMNATLQCICNIPKFVSYFKYNKHLIEKVRNDLINGNKTLSSSFKLLIEKLWPDRLRFYNNPNSGSIGTDNSFLNKKNESYAPKEFKTKISNMNELFKGVAANDAKDLVNFLIMTLHGELNNASKQNVQNNNLFQDQTNKQLMFQLFTQDFINNNISIISDLFYGVNYNVVQCLGCGVKSFNYQTYFFLVFPLEEIRLYKNQNNFNNNCNYGMNFNNNEVNIYDCFLYDQRVNYMNGENAMFCNYCKRTCNSQMCTFLAFGPEILIIILNRGQGIQYEVKINFVEELNLYNFIEFKDTGVNYQLIGVITHLGVSDMSGHFIAYCKNPISNSWYQFNDSVVNEVNYYNFKAEVIDYAMPYLLFYQRKK